MRFSYFILCFYLILIKYNSGNKNHYLCTNYNIEKLTLYYDLYKYFHVVITYLKNNQIYIIYQFERTDDINCLIKGKLSNKLNKKITSHFVYISFIKHLSTFYSTFTYYNNTIFNINIINEFQLLNDIRILKNLTIFNFEQYKVEEIEQKYTKLDFSTKLILKIKFFFEDKKLRIEYDNFNNKKDINISANDLTQFIIKTNFDTFKIFEPKIKEYYFYKKNDIKPILIYLKNINPGGTKLNVLFTTTNSVLKYLINLFYKNKIVIGFKENIFELKNVIDLRINITDY